MKGKLILFGTLFLLLGLGIYAQSSHYIAVTWGASTTSGVKYNIYRATSSTGTYAQVATDVAALTYNDTAGVGGTTYYYEVSAICDATTTCPTGITGESTLTGPSNGATFLASPASPQGAPTAVAH